MIADILFPTTQPVNMFHIQRTLDFYYIFLL